MSDDEEIYTIANDDYYKQKSDTKVYNEDEFETNTLLEKIEDEELSEINQNSVEENERILENTENKNKLVVTNKSDNIIELTKDKNNFTNDVIKIKENNNETKDNKDEIVNKCNEICLEPKNYKINYVGKINPHKNEVIKKINDLQNISPNITKPQNKPYTQNLINNTENLKPKKIPDLPVSSENFVVTKMTQIENEYFVRKFNLEQKLIYDENRIIFLEKSQDWDKIHEILKYQNKELTINIDKFSQIFNILNSQVKNTNIYEKKREKEKKIEKSLENYEKSYHNLLNRLESIKSDTYIKEMNITLQQLQSEISDYEQSNRKARHKQKSQEIQFERDNKRMSISASEINKSLRDIEKLEADNINYKEKIFRNKEEIEINDAQIRQINLNYTSLIEIAEFYGISQYEISSLMGSKVIDVNKPFDINFIREKKSSLSKKIEDLNRRRELNSQKYKMKYYENFEEINKNGKIKSEVLNRIKERALIVKEESELIKNLYKNYSESGQISKDYYLRKGINPQKKPDNQDNQLKVIPEKQEDQVKSQENYTLKIDIKEPEIDNGSQDNQDISVQISQKKKIEEVLENENFLILKENKENEKLVIKNYDKEFDISKENGQTIKTEVTEVTESAPPKFINISTEHKNKSFNEKVTENNDEIQKEKKILKQKSLLKDKKKGVNEKLRIDEKNKIPRIQEEQESSKIIIRNQDIIKETDEKKISVDETIDQIKEIDDDEEIPEIKEKTPSEKKKDKKKDVPLFLKDFNFQQVDSSIKKESNEKNEETRISREIIPKKDLFSDIFADIDEDLKPNEGFNNKSKENLKESIARKNDLEKLFSGSPNNNKVSTRINNNPGRGLNNNLTSNRSKIKKEVQKDDLDDLFF